LQQQRRRYYIKSQREGQIRLKGHEKDDKQGLEGDGSCVEKVTPEKEEILYSSEKPCKQKQTKKNK